MVLTHFTDLLTNHIADSYSTNPPSAPAVLPPTGGVREGLFLFSTQRHCDNPFASYDGFNITHYCGDKPEHVAACRQELCEWLGIADDHLVLPHQVHGTRIAEVTPENLTSNFEGIDGLITRMPNVCIGVSTADCVPILFYDTRTGAMGAVHAGWRGTVARIGVIALAAMHDAFGTLPNDIECVIGPSIGPNAFEVGNEVYEAVAAAGFPMQQIAFKAPPLEAYAAINNPKAAIHRLPMDLSSMRWHIDLWEANSWQLSRAGVPSTAIHVTHLCTYTQYKRFFSARRLGIQSGRIFTGIIRKTEIT